MPNYKFVPIKGRERIASIFCSCRKFSDGDLFALIGFKNKKNDVLGELTPVVVNFAVAVKKKNVRKAVVRNRIRRLLRQSIRDAFLSNEYFELAQRLDFVFMGWNSNPGKASLINLQDIAPRANAVFRKAQQYINSSNGAV